MAEERDDSQRTEDPTQRRLDEALKKGDVVKSQELATFIMTAGGALALALFAQSAAREFTARFTIFLDSPAQMSLMREAARSGSGLRIRPSSCPSSWACIAASAPFGAALASAGRSRHCQSSGHRSAG